MFTPVSENTICKAIDVISATRKSVAKANSVQTLAESTDNSNVSFELEAEACNKTWSGFQVEEYRGSGGLRLKHPSLNEPLRDGTQYQHLRKVLELLRALTDAHL